MWKIRFIALAWRNPPLFSAILVEYFMIKVHYERQIAELLKNVRVDNINTSDVELSGLLEELHEIACALIISSGLVLNIFTKET